MAETGDAKAADPELTGDVHGLILDFLAHNAVTTMLEDARHSISELSDSNVSESKPQSASKTHLLLVECKYSRLRCAEHRATHAA